MSRSGLALALSLTLGSVAPATAAQLARDYFRVETQGEWEYLRDGEFTETVRISGENNAGEWLFETLGGPADGTEEWYSNDAGGLRLHKTFDPFTQCWSVFNTPLQILDGEFDVGDAITTEGTATVTVLGVVPLTGPYTAFASVLRAERITVPLDTFDAVVVEVEVADGSETNAITTFWLAEDVGVVKVTFEEGAQRSELTLVSTSLPEPGPTRLALAALSTLAGLRASVARGRSSRVGR